MTDALRAVITEIEPAAALPGPLHGKRLLVKDLIDTAGIRTTYGSKVYAAHVPATTAPAVTRLVAAGAVLVGKANLHEFAWGVTSQNPWYGTVQNPVQPGRTAGGSSGGNAAALAAGLCDLGLGTDTGCSVRLPAACCGVVGLKPSWGRVSTEGVFPLCPTFDTVGPMARTVTEVVAMWSALTGEPPPTPLRAGSTVGLLTRPPSVGGPAQPANHAAERHVETLEALGTLIAIAIERTGAVEKLSKAEASRESEKLRSAILDSVTHEFRTPLTSIKASVTTMLADANLDLSQRHELLTIIDEEADQLNHLIGEAAEMAQLDANQVELHREPHGVSEAIERALAEVQQRLTDHPVEVRVLGNLPLLSIDLDRIASVLVQLLENAAKYSPAASPICIMAETNDGKVTVSVADRGPGIDDFEQALIFDKFYRGKNERYRIQGTGLGLAIAKAVVEAHGGAIGVTSQLGHGSVFYFTVPV